MNERIKQLADRALKECDAAKERGMDQYSKRFAEMIVRECADVAYCHQNGFVVGSMIKAHFGVEE